MQGCKVPPICTTDDLAKSAVTAINSVAKKVSVLKSVYAMNVMSFRLQ